MFSEDNFLTDRAGGRFGDVSSSVHLLCTLFLYLFPGGSVGKESAHSAGDPGSVPGSGISPGEGNDSPLQYSCLKNSMDLGALWATKGWTRLSDQTLISSMISSAPPQIIRQ